MHIRPMAAEDLVAVVRIEAAFASPWTREMLLKELGKKEGVSLVAETEAGEVVGWCCGAEAAGEGELYKIAVAANSQRQGIATLLLHEFIAVLAKRGVEEVYLEVRSQNHAALTLYQQSGWKIQGKRKRYYTDPADDAMVLLRRLQT